MNTIISDQYHYRPGARFINNTAGTITRGFTTTYVVSDAQRNGHDKRYIVTDRQAVDESGLVCKAKSSSTIVSFALSKKRCE